MCFDRLSCEQLAVRSARGCKMASVQTSMRDAAKFSAVLPENIITARSCLKDACTACSNCVLCTFASRRSSSIPLNVTSGHRA
eukprot:6211050-Pleurochrysis_carterae.AAC.5